MLTIFYNFLLLFSFKYVIIYKLNNIMFLTYQLRKELRWTITRKYATP